MCKKWIHSERKDFFKKLLASGILLLGFLETTEVKFTLDNEFCFWNCGFLDRGTLAWLALNTLDHGLEHKAGCCYPEFPSSVFSTYTLAKISVFLTFS